MKALCFLNVKLKSVFSGQLIMWHLSSNNAWLSHIHIIHAHYLHIMQNSDCKLVLFRHHHHLWPSLQLSTLHVVGWIICARLATLIFPAVLEGIPTLQRFLRVNPFTNTHRHTHTQRRTYTHIWCGVWKSVLVLYYQIVTFTGVLISFSDREEYIYFSLKMFTTVFVDPAPKSRLLLW